MNAQVRTICIATILFTAACPSYGAGKKPTVDSQPSNGAESSISQSSANSNGSSSNAGSQGEISIGDLGLGQDTKLRIPFTPIKGYSSKNLVGLKAAERKMQDTLDSSCVTDYVMGHKLEEVKGKSKSQFLEHIRSLTGPIGVTMYTTKSNVLGYTYLGHDTVYTNTRYHTGVSVCDRVSNLGHEILGHAKGMYKHSKVKGKVNRNTGPYVIGYALLACCK